MANSETHCSDNFELLRGIQGIQGPAGQPGAQGPQGVQGAQGNQGPAGENKIDISFQSENLFYVDVINNGYTVVGYYIFPGTDEFVPSYIRIASSILAVNSSVNLDIRIRSYSGTTPSTVGIISTSLSNSSTHVFNLSSTSALANLPATASIFEVSAKISAYTKGINEARIYALEMK